MATQPNAIQISVRDRLDQIFYRQLGLQKHLHQGTDPKDMEPARRSEYVRMQILALQAELFEMLDEIAWKAWSSDKEKFNREAFIREGIDVAHFLINLLLAAGVDADEFFRVFKEKNDVNWLRHFKPGTYDNSDKCPCGRALDDYVEEKHVRLLDGDSRVFHGENCPEYVRILQGMELDA